MDQWKGIYLYSEQLWQSLLKELSHHYCQQLCFGQNGHQRVMTDAKSQCPSSLLFLCCLRLPVRQEPFGRAVVLFETEKLGTFIIAARPGQRWVLG